MSNDIGARIGIDGEKEFKNAIKGINSQLKNLTSEMAASVTSMAGMEDTETNTAKKTDILGRSIDVTKQKIGILNNQYDRQKKKLSELGKALDDALNAEEKNEDAIIKATNAYNRQQKQVNDLGTDINRATTELNKMEKELRDIQDVASDAGNGLEDAADGAKSFGDSFKGAFLGGSISGAIQSLISGVSNLVNETREYSKIMGTLETSSQRAGYTAEQTASSYAQLYDVIGDEQQAATATANLQAIGLSQEELVKITDGAIGAWATYGDSIPIDGLAESINETIQAGKVTGNFADVLNWAGTNEDAFNEKLAAASDNSERANIVLEELASQGLMNSAEAWRENNAELVMANAANRTMQDSTATLGQMLSPIVSSIKQGLASILGWMVQIVQEGNPILSLAAGLATALAAMGLGLFIQNLGGAAGMLTKLKTGFESLNTTMKANPFILIASLIAGVTAAVITLWNTNEEFRGAVKQGWSDIKSFFSSIGTAIKNLAANVKKAISDAVNGVKNIGKQAMSIGKNIVDGVWNGIKNAKDWLINKVKEWCGSVLQGIKDFFHIESPSKVMRDEVGVMLAKGMAEGIANGEKEVLDVATALNEKLLKKEEELTEQLKQTGLDEATTVALNGQLSAVKEFRTEYEKALQDIEKSQESMAKKLQDYGDLFTTVTKGTDSFLELGDLQTDIDAINRYGAALENLKRRGISDSLINKITELGVKEGTSYSEKLLDMTDEQYDEYMKLWEQKQAAAQEVARSFYASEMDALSQEFVDKIPEELSGLKNEMRDLGVYSAQGLANGFTSQRNNIKNSFVDVIQDALLAAKEEMGVHSPSRVWAEFGKNLALGLDNGFVNTMNDVSKDIAEVMYRPLNAVTKDDLYKVSEATVNGMSASQAISGNNQQTIIIPVNLDGIKIAEVTFDPLRNVAKQRGIAFG